MAKTLYIIDTTNVRLIERSTPDLTYMGKFTSGIGNPKSICNDGTHLYLINSIVDGPFRLQKYLIGATIADLSLVASISNFSGSDTFNLPRGMCTDGTYLYLVDGIVNVGRILKFNCSNLSFVASVASIGYTYIPDIETFYSGQIVSPAAIATDNTYLFVTGSYGIYGSWIHVFNCSTLAWVATSALPTVAGGMMDPVFIVTAVDVLGDKIFIAGYEPMLG